MQTSLLVYDDELGDWGPMTDLRAVFDLRTGPLTSLQRIERSTSLAVQSLHVPERLAQLAAHQHPTVTVNAPLESGRWLLINGRWTGLTAAEKILQLPLGEALVQSDGQLIAVHLEHDQANALKEASWRLLNSVRTHQNDSRVLLERPWHILDGLEATMKSDLEASTHPQGDVGKYAAVCFGDHPVRIASDAQLQPNVVFNTTQGPIIIDNGASIGATAVLEGPCYIGPESQVSCHAHMRPHTVVGPVCKVAGEISHTILHGYSNKGHHGYLGHSLVGQWVNLGAATNVSNLKNTYGPVRVQLANDSPPEDSGRTFQGPLIGDYTRTAIGTRLMTGSCIGTGSMISQSTFPSKHIERFSFLTDSSGQTYDIEKFLDTARKMMARRHIDLSEAEESCLRALAAG